MRFVAPVLCIAALAADIDAAQPPRHTIYLTGNASLAELQKANPDHFARAERILAAANELCRPGQDQTDFVRFDARDIRCVGALYKTSNPPKREISFRLDDTRYVARVTVTGVAAKLVPAR